MRPQQKKAIPLKMVRTWHTRRAIFRKLLCNHSSSRRFLELEFFNAGAYRCIFQPPCNSIDFLDQSSPHPIQIIFTSYNSVLLSCFYSFQPFACTKASLFFIAIMKSQYTVLNRREIHFLVGTWIVAITLPFIISVRCGAPYCKQKESRTIRVTVDKYFSLKPVYL